MKEEGAIYRAWEQSYRNLLPFGTQCGPSWQVRLGDRMISRYAEVRDRQWVTLPSHPPSGV